MNSLKIGILVLGKSVCMCVSVVLAFTGKISIAGFVLNKATKNYPCPPLPPLSKVIPPQTIRSAVFRDLISC